MKSIIFAILIVVNSTTMFSQTVNWKTYNVDGFIKPINLEGNPRSIYKCNITTELESYSIPVGAQITNHTKVSDNWIVYKNNIITVSVIEDSYLNSIKASFYVVPLEIFSEYKTDAELSKEIGTRSSNIGPDPFKLALNPLSTEKVDAIYHDFLHSDDNTLIFFTLSDDKIMRVWEWDGNIVTGPDSHKDYKPSDWKLINSFPYLGHQTPFSVIKNEDGEKNSILLVDSQKNVHNIIYRDTNLKLNNSYQATGFLLEKTVLIDTNTLLRYK